MANTGTELAKAYVQIIPSAEGIKGSISEALGSESEEAGKKSGISIASMIKGAIAAAGIGTALKAAISEGAALEQSFQGGLDTLYGDAADKAREYAKAAASAGISMNSYAEQAVSFGAALKAALGDEDKAAESANLAIMDMADNAAKMGSDIGSIQNAYQGFAKGNYTMLDNLKLGYGGTKTEMERLLKDAQALSGVEYNIDNLADVYSAIHVVQEELGLSGVAAEEASTTISGSFGAMQASAQNFLGQLVLGEDIKPALLNLVESASTFLLDNLMPAVGRVIMALPDVIGTFITDILPSILDQGMEMINTLADGMDGNMTGIIASALTMVQSFLSTIVEHLPEFIAAAARIIASIVVGLIENLPNLLKGAIELITGLVDEFLSYDWASLGSQIIQGIIDGLKNAKDALVNAAKDAAGNLLSSVKDALGIHSPSRVFRDEVGKNVALGMAEGIANNTDAVSSAMDQLTAASTGSLTLSASGSIGSGIAGAEMVNEPTINAIMQIGTAIVSAINNKDTAAYLDGTLVSRAIYSSLEGEGKRRGTSLVGGY